MPHLVRIRMHILYLAGASFQHDRLLSLLPQHVNLVMSMSLFFLSPNVLCV